MDYLLHDADPKLILCEPDKEGLIAEIDSSLTTLLVDTQRPYQDIDFFRSAPEECARVDIEPDDPGLIIYTSGTTGKPKGAVLTQNNLVHDAKNVIYVWEISEADVLCHALPFFHVHGLCFALHTSLLAGAQVLMPDQFSPAGVIALLSKKEAQSTCTVFMAVPSMYAKLMEYLGDKSLDCEHMRLWTSGSAPLLPQDFERIHKTFGKHRLSVRACRKRG